MSSLHLVGIKVSQKEFLLEFLAIHFKMAVQLRVNWPNKGKRTMYSENNIWQEWVKAILLSYNKF